MNWCGDSRAARQRRVTHPARCSFTSSAGIRVLMMWGAVLCWALSAVPGFAQKKVEVPRGYAEAAPARQPARLAPAPRAPQAAPAAAEPSVLGILTGALGEVVDPNVRALEQQYLPRVEQYMKSELGFVKRVCDPDKEQFQAIAVAAREHLRPAVRQYAVAMNRLQRGQMGGGGASALTPPDTAIQKEVAAILKEKLRPDQFKLYEEECDCRTSRRKRAVVMNLIVKLDEELGFTPEQRASLVETLTEGYQETWEQWLELMQHNAEFTPGIPNRCIVPVLNKEQQEVWGRLSKTGSSVMIGGFVAPPIVVIEDDIAWEGLEDAQ